MESELQKLNKISAFTLIELMMVIVILGVLSAVAIPRFSDVSREARVASINGFSGALRAQSDIINQSCRVTPGCLSATWGQTIYITPLKHNVQMLRGYADAGEINTPNQIDSLIDHAGFELSAHNSGKTTRWSVVNTINCYAQYTQPDNIADAKPTIIIEDSGC